MNWLDIVIVCILVLLVINGIRKGFILSLFTFIALILGVWAALHFSGFMSSFLIKIFHPTGNWLVILSYSLTFLLVVIGVIIIGKLLEKVVKTVGLGLANRIVGGLFGLVKGVLGVTVLLFIIVHFDPKEKLINHKTKDTSFCYPYVEKVFPFYSRVMFK